MCVISDIMTSPHFIIILGENVVLLIRSYNGLICNKTAVVKMFLEALDIPLFAKEVERYYQY